MLYRLRSNILYITFVIFSAFYMQGCYYDVEEELYPTEEVGDVTYSDDIKRIINSSCATPGCHVEGGDGAGVFTTYEGLSFKIDNGSFRDRVVVRKDMPPSFALSTLNIRKIEKWLSEGALNN